MKFALPEVKGKILYSLTTPNIETQLHNQAIRSATSSKYPLGISTYQYLTKELFSCFYDIEYAILHILSHTQSQEEYHAILQQMTPHPQTASIQTSENRIFNLLHCKYDFHKLRKLKKMLKQGKSIFPDKAEKNTANTLNEEILRLIES